MHMRMPEEVTVIMVQMTLAIMGFAVLPCSSLMDGSGSSVKIC